MKGSWEPKVFADLQQYNVNIEYEAEKLSYTVPASKHKYIPDFKLTLPSGRQVYIEAKGWLRPDDTKKLVLVKKEHPEKDIRIVFQKISKMHKKSERTNADWAEKHGFPWCVGTIPSDWLSE